MSDDALMVRVKQGDLDRLGLLFERYHRRLFAFFYRLTQNRESSEDLVQQVFERIIRYRQSFSEEGSFSAWIFGIARNLHLDYIRKNEEHHLERNHDWNQLPEPDTDISDEEKYRQFQLRIAMDKLDPDKKTILILSRFEGFRYKEIAEIMNTSEGAIKVKVFRALQDLREIMNQTKKGKYHDQG